MTRIALIAGMVFAAAFADAQSSRTPFRFEIRHADPWFVKALLEGMSLRSPEVSTLPGAAGVLTAASNAAAKLIRDGYLIVNPTDNSLWYYPKPEGNGF